MRPFYLTGGLAFDLANDFSLQHLTLGYQLHYRWIAGSAYFFGETIITSFGSGILLSSSHWVGFQRRPLTGLRLIA
ncbi:hypothetical protein KCP78_11440 [Salmonella enterica subsp. enterica]|nr:hypothetical protein KCP78_11440 [Salmonella enterica subsp. enterica]